MRSTSSLGSVPSKRLSYTLLLVWALVSLVIVPVSAAIIGKRGEDAAKSTNDIAHYDTHEAAWTAIGEAYAKGNVLKAAYIKSTGTFISNIKFQEQKLAKRFNLGGVFHHLFPNAGKYIPGITFTEHQINGQGTYFTPWEPASCVFYNDKSLTDVRRDFTTTITKASLYALGFDLGFAQASAKNLGAVITNTNTVTQHESYMIKAGNNCQLWVEPLMLWQIQQHRDCKMEAVMTNDKVCTPWSPAIKGIFLVQNKININLQCGEKSIRRNDCGKTK